MGTSRLSAEPFWKKTARRVLPNEQRAPLGPFRGLNVRSPHETLVVWVAEYNLRDGQQTPVTLSSVEAVMADGQVAVGQIRFLPDRSMSCEFSCFAREANNIELRVHYRTQPAVTFTVPNPRPAQARQWTPLSLPQTNRHAHTEVTLARLSTAGPSGTPALSANLRARSLDGARVGWVGWRVTTFDPLGNWIPSRSRPRFGQSTIVPSLPSMDQTWKLLVEGDEYISLGFPNLPANGTSLAVPVSARAEEVGLRYVVVTSGSSYRMTNGVVSGAASNSAPNLSLPALKLSVGTGTNWTLDVAAAGTAILCVSERDDAVPPGGRFRERLAVDGGSIFSSFGRTNLTWKVAEKTWSASLVGSMATSYATNLELEMISPMPRTEFFITPPKR